MEKKNMVEDITNKLEEGVKELFESEKYTKYLETMAKFYNYSANNCLLIALQCPSASYVAGYEAWKTKFKRQVRKGEKAIRILAPIPHKKEIEDENGEKKEIKWTTFRAVSVFDIQQTDGEELPKLCETLKGCVEKYSDIMEKLQTVSPVPMGFEDIPGTANGYFHSKENRIAIQEGMSEEQTLKTAVHEIAHSLLHCEEGEEKEADRRTKEVQAESVAYTVLKALGIDTSEYSFGYVAGWSSGKDVKELSKSLEVIRKTASEILTKLAA